MRSYRIKLDEMGITRWQYEELKAFCRQYPEKKAQAAELLGVGIDYFAVNKRHFRTKSRRR